MTGLVQFSAIPIGLGMIVIGAALGIGKFAAAAAESIARQPSAADGDRLREEIRAKARTEADHIVRNAERQIQLETSRALEQIRREAVDLSVMIASKIIQRNLSKEDNERLIDDALKQVQGRG